MDLTIYILMGVLNEKRCNIPKSNEIEINDNLSTRLWLVNGYPMVNFIAK